MGLEQSKLEEKKNVVRRYCNALSAGDIAGCLKLTSVDYTCWVPGPKDKIPVCGHHKKSVSLCGHRFDRDFEPLRKHGRPRGVHGRPITLCQALPRRSARTSSCSSSFR